MSDWTPEMKEEVVARYVEEMEKFPEEERGQHSTEVCKDIAKEFDKTTNGVRIILTKAEVYVKKVPTAKAASTASGSGTKRVNKAQAIEELKSSISLIDQDLIDEEIISKLTGKAAQYFTGVVQQAVALQG
jgi:hypothetical protein